MGKTTIEWSDYTFNPWIGCSKVSPGYQYCYAEHMMDDRFGKAEWGPNGTRVKTSPDNWKQPLQWNKKAEKEGKRFKVFCASLADVFEDRFDLLDWRDELFELIEQTPHLDWLLLTKRPELARDLSPYPWDVKGWPDNVWPGTSIENQEQLEIRAPHLLRIPAKIRFLSCEPLLEAINFGYLKDQLGFPYHGLKGVGFADDYQPCSINWVIVGGESGPNARPMHPLWVESIKDQCEAAGVPFFFKQWGAWQPNWGAGDHLIYPDGTVIEANHEHSDAREKNAEPIWKVGKKKAGNLLSGLVHTQFPKPINSEV